MSSQPCDLILSGHNLYLKGIRTSDVAALVSLFCEDAVLMPPNETSLYGKAEIKEWFQEYFEHFRITSFSYTERDVTALDGWVIERCSHMVNIAPLKGGQSIRDDGRSIFIWKREADGSWRISQFIFNSVRPIGSGTSRFLARMTHRRGPN